jgi:Raf kinase inhibitor-like YbhB/YbcL family protein
MFVAPVASRARVQAGKLGVLVLFVGSVSACSKHPESDGTASSPPRSGTMKIESTAFTANAEVPVKHTCEGGDVAPPLTFTGVPASAKSLALIVDDPDAPDPAAPRRTWVHWVVYDLPPSTRALPEGGSLPAGARVGNNDWKKAEYGGPCPPIGRHRYFHKLYALDRMLGDLGAGATKADLEKAMTGHVIDSAELVGTYQKKG